jgi:predicted Na+-dependent transporter
LDLVTHGPLGILWVSLGLGAFYIALVWINTLLGVFLTPLFIVPLTWLQDAVVEKRRRRAGLQAATVRTVSTPEPRAR